MSDVVVLAYFPDDLTRVYQLAQWLPVLEVLDDDLRVGVVTRDPAVAESCRRLTRLPVHLAPSFAELMALYGELDAKLVLYCNNSPRNFESLVDPRMLHVHVNHGESDKQSMASNNAKAYDRVFVAGTAAVERHRAGLMEFDPARLVRVGRPQLDLHPEPLLAASERRTVLYAPTWEGDADYNSYTSVDVYGRAIVGSILALPRVRLVYKPHPKVTTSDRPDIRDAHRAILDTIAAGRRPRARRRPHGHHERRHPRRDARLRRHRHRCLLGRPRLALPADGQAHRAHRPAPRPGPAAHGRAGEPLRRCRRRAPTWAV